MTNSVIIDSSPLIILLKSNLIGTLPRLFEEIFVPDAVWSEILSGKENDAARRSLPKLVWARKTKVEARNDDIASFNLGTGETEVLKLALTVPAAVVLDDFAARKCAKAMGIRFVGTGGILILAKRKGLILSVSESLKKVQNAGLWLSDDVIELLKRKAGE